MELLIFDIDWRSTLVPTVALSEIVFRGTVMYLGIFVILRIVSKREAGSMGTGDLLMMVLLADAAQNGMASEYKSIPEGLALVGTIVVWNFVLDWLGHRFPGCRRLLQPSPVMLIKDGRLLRRNLQREMITTEELLSQVREQGVETLGEVRTAHLESDGRVSVIPQGSSGGARRERKGPP